MNWKFSATLRKVTMGSSPNISLTWAMVLSVSTSTSRSSFKQKRFFRKQKKINYVSFFVNCICMIIWYKIENSSENSKIWLCYLSICSTTQKTLIINHFEDYKFFCYSKTNQALFMRHLGLFFNIKPGLPIFLSINFGYFYHPVLLLFLIGGILDL